MTHNNLNIQHVRDNDGLLGNCKWIRVYYHPKGLMPVHSSSVTPTFGNNLCMYVVSEAWAGV